MKKATLIILSLLAPLCLIVCIISMIVTMQDINNYKVIEEQKSVISVKQYLIEDYSLTIQERIEKHEKFIEELGETKIENISVGVNSTIDTNLNIDNVEDADIDLMARVVMSEASISNYDAKVAVAETIINRCNSQKFPNSVKKVVYAENQFSTQDNGEVNEACYEAVYDALRNPTHPDNMYYFRTGYPHAKLEYYDKIDQFYFSIQD